jgi:hypothetical protein
VSSKTSIWPVATASGSDVKQSYAKPPAQQLSLKGETTNEKQSRSLVRLARSAFRYACSVHRDGIVSRWAELKLLYDRRDRNDVSQKRAM